MTKERISTDVYVQKQSVTLTSASGYWGIFGSYEDGLVPEALFELRRVAPVFHTKNRAV